MTDVERCCTLDLVGQDRVERALERALQLTTGRSTPPRLKEALYDAVFPGGGRLRPRLTLAVAEACGKAVVPVADAAAAAVELLHCASLVHDDLPCFDDAPLRRGRPSIHRAYGTEMAVLVGDGLIVAAYEVLADGCRRTPRLLPALVTTMAMGSGSHRGIVAGQAWESEPSLDLQAYHQAKTGALFEASTRAGAIAGGGNPEQWAELGRTMGEAYQVADDIKDVVGSEASLGKPVGQDAALGRPSAVHSLGVSGAHDHLDGLIQRLHDSVPACHDRSSFDRWVQLMCARVFPSRPTREAPAARPAVYLRPALATA